MVQILAFLTCSLLILGCIIVFNYENIFSFVFSIILPVLVVLNLFFTIYWLTEKSKYFLINVMGVIVYFLCFDSFIQFNRSNENLNADSLSMMTFNTGQFGLSNEVNDFISEQDADILVIQEFWNRGIEPLSQYPHYFSGYRKGKKKAHQVIFSKFPIINRGYIDFPNTTNNAMYVDISYDDEIIRIYNLHLESYRIDDFHQLNTPSNYEHLFKRIPEAEKIRKEQAILVKNHMDNFNGKVILCGDFNSTQFTSIYRLLKDSKKDSFVESGSGFGATYKLSKYPFRIDYIIVDNAFEVLVHRNFNQKISDHEPIFVRLKAN